MFSDANEYIADVRPADGRAAFRATIQEPHIEITFKAPEVGQSVRVTFHPKDHKVKFDRSDPGIYRHVAGVPDFHGRGDPVKDADEQAVADDHTAEAQARWEASLKRSPAPRRDPIRPPPA